MRFLLVLAAIGFSACSTATYRIVKKGTWKIGTPKDEQPVEPVYLHNVAAVAPGGEAAIIVVYFGADEAPLVEAKGDSSALVEATASAGRKALDLAISLAKPPGPNP